VNDPPPSLPPVPLGTVASAGNGVTVQVAALEAVNGTARGPGNIAGPALRATVRISNGTSGPLSLDGVAVDLAHGDEQLPASPLDDPSAAPFHGVVAAGGTATGVYVFTVPEDDREHVTVTVGYQAGAPLVVFAGPAR
jgi:hypothetical protein